MAYQIRQSRKVHTEKALKPETHSHHAEEEYPGTSGVELDNTIRGHSFAKISIFPPDGPPSAQTQSMSTIHSQTGTPTIPGPPEINWPAVQNQSRPQANAASAPIQAKPEGINHTGIPSTLKTNVEALSGVSLDHTKTHYNSPEPAKIGALAFTRGTEIHLGPGQEHHLPHEAWHAAQQQQGDIPVTTSSNGTSVNDDPTLENEADIMGAKAAGGDFSPPQAKLNPRWVPSTFAPVQKVIPGLGHVNARNQVDAGWVDAYIQDVTHPTAHLYDEDIIRYMDNHDPGWRNFVEMENTGGNHWDVRIRKDPQTVVTVTTVADGNCGVYAIHAAMNRGGINADQDHYDCGGDFITTVRQWVRGQVGNDRDEIKDRIIAEIQNCNSVVLTGFGPNLMELLAPIEIGGDNQSSSSSSNLGMGAKKGTLYGRAIADDAEDGGIYLYDPIQDESYAFQDPSGIRDGDIVFYTKGENHRAIPVKVIHDDHNTTVAVHINEIAERLGILSENALQQINAKPDKDTQISPYDIILSFCVEFEGILKDFISLPNDTRVTMVFKPEEWSACYNTADRLFRLLSVNSNDAYRNGRLPIADFKASQMGENQVKVEERTKQMSEIMSALIEDMNISLGKGMPRIYNCGFGIHGFAFIARNGYVELLQSFANGLAYKLPGITVAQSIKLNKSFPGKTMLTILDQMVGNEKMRSLAQMALFETTIETPTHPFPLCEFYWEGNFLKSGGDMDQAIVNRLNKNLLIMKQVAKIIKTRTTRIGQARKLLA